jgi:hypothetical protein
MSELLDKSKKHPGGPKTPEGKRRSSLNSMRHGLTSQTIVLPQEDASKFDELLADYIDQYSPETKLELDLVHELAATRWRLQRMWGIETTVLAIAAQRTSKQAEEEFRTPSPNIRVALAFMDLAENSRTITLMNRYESRLSRRLHQVLTELEHLQARRKAQEHAAEKAAEVSESPDDPKTLRVVLTIPKKIVRNELPQPILLTRRDDKMPLHDNKIPPKEDDAA